MWNFINILISFEDSKHKSGYKVLFSEKKNLFPSDLKGNQK